MTVYHPRDPVLFDAPANTSVALVASAQYAFSAILLLKGKFQTKWQSFVQVKTLDQVMTRSRGLGPGFDFLRIGLAILIFYAHTNMALRDNGIVNLFGGAGTGITNLMPAHPQSLAPVDFLQSVKSRLYILYVPMFFALSGFLVTGSAARTASISTFLKFRALRIFPALTVEVVLSALVLGAFFSTLPLQAYVSNPQFLRYFGNVLGFVTFELPGVFEGNPASGLVNPNLWTLPAEFYCYFMMSALMIVGLLRRRHVAFIGMVSLSIILIFSSILYGFGLSKSVLRTTAVVYYFFVGASFYIWRDKIPISVPLFIASGALTLMMMRNPTYTFLIPIFLTYVTVYLGHLRVLAMPFMKGRDYSYGIYLYGFPITQAVISLNADITRPALFAVGLGITAIFAMASWHLIEKPMLALKKQRPMSVKPAPAPHNTAPRL